MAVDTVTLEVGKGELVALLGPSGCGKTTTLRMVAGFVAPSAGRVQVNGKDITGLAAHRRNMGVVFQSYALFPHLDILRNVAFGLRMRGMSQAACRQKAGAALEMVALSHLANRYRDWRAAALGRAMSAHRAAPAAAIRSRYQRWGVRHLAFAAIGGQRQ
jgi:putative spermidine/putrescine transport system ATP-binding protein